MNLEEVAKALAIDLDASVARFAGNRTLYARFLKKFPDDQSMTQLQTAIEQKDSQALERSAHTLKGVCANLGLSRLADLASAVVSAVRNGDADSLYADTGLLNDCRKEYDRVCKLITELQ